MGGGVGGGGSPPTHLHHKAKNPEAKKPGSQELEKPESREATQKDKKTSKVTKQ